MSRLDFFRRRTGEDSHALKTVGRSTEGKQIDTESEKSSRADHDQ
jgi:hypothetical protein